MATRRTKKKEESQAQLLMDAVKNLQPDDVVDEIGKLQVSLQGTLSGITATITSKIETMQNLDGCIGQKQNELKELFDIEKEAQNLEDLKANIEEARKEWDEEKKERSKTWTREEEERDYMWQQRQQRHNEEFAAEVARMKRAEQVRQEELHRGWAERESVLAAQENEAAALRDKVAGFDEVLKKEVSKAEAVVSNSVKKQYEHQIALMQKDAESERNIDNAKIESLQGTIKDLEGRILALTAQLDAARRDAKDVTAAALESASGRQVADALRKVVDRDGSNGSKSSK